MQQFIGISLDKLNIIFRIIFIGNMIASFAFLSFEADVYTKQTNTS